MKAFWSLAVIAFLTSTLHAQTKVPVFGFRAGGAVYTLAGNSPQNGGTTKIPVVLVPVTLTFHEQGSHRAQSFDATQDVPSILHSPVFASYRYPSGDSTQFADALLRASVPHAASWHTLLQPVKIAPITVTVPAADGYTLYSRKNGGRIAVVDLQFLVNKLFQKLPHEPGKLVIAFTHDTTYYAIHDATVCCGWGAHGVDSATGDAFVLSTYLHHAPAIVRDQDIQPLTQQLAEYLYDPLHNPLYSGRFHAQPGNHFPSSWRRPFDRGCGGDGVGSYYFQLEPTDTNLKNDFPESPSFVLDQGGHTYHVENIALLSWYLKAADAANGYSFPDAHVLTAPASSCSYFAGHKSVAAPAAEVTIPKPSAHASHHWLIGYWGSRAPNGRFLPLRDVSRQWDVVIVAFASPKANAPEGVFQFNVPEGYTPAEFKADIALLKNRGQKVMISLGGGGVFVHLGDPGAEPRFVHSIEQIASEWGFDGIDIDFESPSLELAPGDTDFRHPVTSSIVHLIAALKQMHQHFGPKFMISLVPEGPQIPAGYRTYGGQFGSYIPIIYALHNILSFVDVQDYNTPPMEGLDGEIYQAHTVDYYAALTELSMRGFPVAGNKTRVFPGLSPQKSATGFLVDYAMPSKVSAAMRYIMTGKAPAGIQYHLVQPGGYPDFLGAMFWDIDGDWADNSRYSRVIGPQLHGTQP